jgi:ornithine cyclodeaminase
MNYIDAAKVEARLGYPFLVDVLEKAFRDGAIAPPRHHHGVPLDGRPNAMWLLMPAISAKPGASDKAGPYMGMKSVTVFPDNAARTGKPAVLGMYLLLSTESGETLAILDATRLTVLRTAGASALAARYLAREDASDMVMVGAGQLAPYLIRAHASVRPIKRVKIWNRTIANAEAVARAFARSGIDVQAVDDLEAACRTADLISAATLSTQPLIKGAWLKPGVHIDTVGAFTKTMRETDDELVQRAHIFVDTYAGAMGEAGDLLQPMEAGVIGKDALRADLFELTHGTKKGRTSPDEITYFKSVGASIEDLAAAIAVYEAR